MNTATKQVIGPNASTMQTMDSPLHLSHLMWARITGTSILLMALVGGLTYGAIHSIVHIPNDPLATSAAISANRRLVLLAIAAWAVVAMLDLIVSLGIYALYHRTSRVGSLATASLRLLYTAFLVVATARLIPLAMGDDGSGAIGHFENFETIWSVGLVVFGFHLFGLGLLGLKSDFSPNLLGVLLVIAGLSYVLAESTELVAHVFPATISVVLALFMITGELGFGVWLTLWRPPIVTLARHSSASWLKR